MMQQVTHVNFRESNINGRSTELNVEIVMTTCEETMRSISYMPNNVLV